MFSILKVEDAMNGYDGQHDVRTGNPPTAYLLRYPGGKLFS